MSWRQMLSNHGEKTSELPEPRVWYLLPRLINAFYDYLVISNTLWASTEYIWHLIKTKQSRKKRRWITKCAMLLQTLSSNTKSIRCFPSGLMSFRTKAMMMSMPLDSCRAIAVWKDTSRNEYQWKYKSQIYTILHIFTCSNDIRLLLFFLLSDKLLNQTKRKAEFLTEKPNSCACIAKSQVTRSENTDL